MWGFSVLPETTGIVIRDSQLLVTNNGNTGNKEWIKLIMDNMVDYLLHR